MWRIYSIISYIVGLIFVCRIKMRQTWFDRAQEWGEGYYAEDTNKNKVERIYYGIKSATDGVQLIFEKEDFLDKILKFFLICREFQTGDPDFDKKIFIIADDHIVADVLQTVPALRQELVDLLYNRPSLEILLIAMSKEGIWVEMSGKAANHLTSEVTAELRDFLKRLKSAFASYTTPESCRHYQWYRVMQLFNLSMVSGVILPFIIFNHFDSVNLIHSAHIKHLTIISTITIAGIFLGMIVIVLKRTSYAMLLIRDFTLMGFLGLIYLSSQLYRAINIEMDAGTPRVENVQVLGKEIHRSRRSTSYYITLSDWDNRNKTHRLSVNSAVYNMMPDRGEAYVRIHKGYLNDEWIDYY